MTAESMDLAGKAILVTGASSGIGAATALALGRAGARVALAARRVDACAELARQIEAEGGEALVLGMDVSVEVEVGAAVAATVARFGRLDGAFNNAGVLGPAFVATSVYVTGVPATSTSTPSVLVMPTFAAAATVSVSVAELLASAGSAAPPAAATVAVFTSVPVALAATEQIAT